MSIYHLTVQYWQRHCRWHCHATDTARPCRQHGSAS